MGNPERHLHLVGEEPEREEAAQEEKNEKSKNEIIRINQYFEQIKAQLQNLSFEEALQSPVLNFDQVDLRPRNLGKLKSFVRALLIEKGKSEAGAGLSEDDEFEINRKVVERL